MGSCKHRQGKSLDISTVQLHPRPLTEGQMKRQAAKDDVEKRATIGKRVIEWLRN